MEILISFLHSKKLGIPRTVFRRYHLGTFQICWNAKFQYRVFIFGCVLKPEAVYGAFQNRKSGLVSFLVDERCFGTYLNIGQTVKEVDTWDRIYFQKT